MAARPYADATGCLHARHGDGGIGRLHGVETGADRFFGAAVAERGQEAGLEIVSSVRKRMQQRLLGSFARDSLQTEHGFFPQFRIVNQLGYRGHVVRRGDQRQVPQSHYLLDVVTLASKKIEQPGHNLLALVKLSGIIGTPGVCAKTRRVHLFAHRMDDVVESFGGCFSDVGACPRQGVH